MSEILSLSKCCIFRKDIKCLKMCQLQSNLDLSNSDISNSAKLEESIWIKKYTMIAFSNNNLVLGTLLQVQITRSAN